MTEQNGRINFNATPGENINQVAGFGWRTTGDSAAKSDMIRGNWEPNS